MSVHIRLVQGDALDVPADVLALKFAQGWYGVDRLVALRFAGDQFDMRRQAPPVGAHFLVGAHGTVAASDVLFVGVEPLGRFDYLAIRQFAHRALAIVGRERPATEHVAFTLHGVGFGLDENEALRAEVAGFVDALASSDMPHALRRITIVEKNAELATRLSTVLDAILPDGTLHTPSTAGDVGVGEIHPNLHEAGALSRDKPHVFVAMPFAEEYSDRYHYGIVNAAKAAGLLCERADLTSFTGDVVAWVKDRIASATLVVADLTAANPNVYLEVGYAWGRDVRTVLIAPVGDEIKFDVRAHRCILFKSIRHLEEQLSTELKNLTAKS